MVHPQTEQRGARRFPLALPISLRVPSYGKPSVDAHTRDVSARGVFFYVDADLAQGSAVDFIMTLPEEITLALPIRVHCHGKIVRVDISDNYRGVAVAIDKYDFVNTDA